MKITQESEGTLTIKAETQAEVAELFKHLRLDIGTQTYVDALVAGTYTHFSDEKRRWFPVTTETSSFILPYMDKLESITGFKGTINLPEAPWNDYHNKLCHTHMVTHASLLDGVYTCSGFIQSKDWNKKSAAVNAHERFDEYIRAFLGFTFHEPEFIEAGNHMMKRNPNYPKTHKTEPKMTSRMLWHYIFNTWWIQHATEGQNAVVADAMDCYLQISQHETAFTDSMLLKGTDKFNCDGWKREVKFEDFKVL